MYIDSNAYMYFFQFFFHVEEIEWAIEEAVKTGMVVVATMAISVKGDGNGIPAGECAVRMAKAGAQVGKQVTHKCSNRYLFEQQLRKRTLYKSQH